MVNKYEIYKKLFEKTRKLLAVVIDPDNSQELIMSTLEQCKKGKIDLIFLGGSLVTKGSADAAARIIKENSDIPVLLFPGNELQLTNKADALLLLSLISGRNPELLIGKHVVAAPFIKRSKLEVIPTGYILIDGGRPTSVTYMSNTIPIPADKPDIAAATALAGEQLGMKLIFLEAGSGALNPVSEEMIRAVYGAVDIPIIVGGGINTQKDLEKIYFAGAKLVVIGTSVEKDSSVIAEMAEVRNSCNEQEEESVKQLYKY
jgi:phosphoglycerol geranylgeranyltransferase